MLSTPEFARSIGVKKSNKGGQVRGWERGYRAIPGPVQTILQLAQEVPGVIEWLWQRSGCVIDEADDGDPAEHGDMAGGTDGARP